MKNIKLLGLGVFLFVVQSVSALRVDVTNLGETTVFVDPVWTGTKRGWRGLAGGVELRQIGRTEDAVVRYDTGVHHLKGLLVHYKETGKCFYYFFGPNGFRGTGKILISVNAEVVDGKQNAELRSIVVEGHTDVVFQKQTRVSQVVEKKEIDCDRVNNFT